MITLTFEAFASGNYDTEEENYALYVVRDAKQVYYVGISETGVWSRWFGTLGRMGQTESGEWIGGDDISQEIISHIPESLNYLIDLYTEEECVRFITDHGLRSSLDLKRIESSMIDLLKPCLNRMGNRHQRDPHPEETINLEKYAPPPEIELL